MIGDWLFISFGIPAIIALCAYMAVRLYERDLDRKQKLRQPGE
ncbi:hypothetical protein [Rhizobium sp. FY34]|nr:hypothetical protein [Rhizobium sp. FY34]